MLSWFRPKGKLILSLIKAGWIDQDHVSRLIVHDWHDHADASVKKRLERAGLPFLSLAPKVTGQCTPTLPDRGSLPEPEPSQSLAMPEPEPRDKHAPPRGYALDEQFREYEAACREWGMNLVEPEDFFEAFRWEWTNKDFHQRRAAIEAVRSRIAVGIDPMGWKPKNFLKSEWRRPITPRKGGHLTVEEIAAL